MLNFLTTSSGLMCVYRFNEDQSLCPSEVDAVSVMQSIKLGDVVSIEIKKSRNYEFHKKWFALIQLMFEQKFEHFNNIEYKGTKVLPNFDRFRKDVIIKTGRYTPVFNADGEVRLEADSISFGRMSADEFDKLYSDTVQVALDLLSNFNEQDITDAIDAVMALS